MTITATGTSAQVPSKLTIGGQLLSLWLTGRVAITPTAEASQPPSELRERPQPHNDGNGKGTLSDDDVARLFVLAGVDRCRRVFAEFDQQPPLPLHDAEAAAS